MSDYYQIFRYIIIMSILGRGKIVAHMMEVFRWKTGISAEGLSTRILLHNTLQKWTEILEKVWWPSLPLFLCNYISLCASVLTFLLEISQISSWQSSSEGCSSGVVDTLRLVSLKEFCSSQTDWLIFIPPPLPRPHLVLGCPPLCLRYKTQTTKDLDQNFRF